MTESNQQGIVDRVVTQSRHEFSQKTDQLIQALETNDWMNHPNGHWLDNLGYLSNILSARVYQTHTEAVSASGFANSGDTWVETYQMLSRAVTLSGRKTEFDQLWQKIKETAFTVTQCSKVFSNINSNSNQEPGSVVKQGLERLTSSQNTFANDVALYGCFQHFSDTPIDPKYVDYINQRWEIWRSGFGVTRDKQFVNGYCFYCYKSI